MNKNYTLKITLAMLVVILISLVSFVGVYKGKSVMKEYSLGKDLSQRHIAKFTVVEETTEETETSEETETTEEAEVKEESPEEKTKKYIESKNIIEKRLAAMRAEDFEVRLEENGDIEIEVPTSIDASMLNEIMAESKVEIKNDSTGEVIMDASAIKSASTKIDSVSYTKPIVKLTIKFTNDAKKKFKAMDPMYTDEEGNTSKTTFSIVIDGETLYSDSSEPGSFLESAKNGSLDLIVGSNSSESELEEDSQAALIRIAQLNNGTLPAKYQIDSIDMVSTSTSLKAIVFTLIIIGGILFIYALIKFKNSAILPMISIIGMVAALLLTLRYTNVKITLFTILGIALITILNYILVMKSLNSDKKYKDNLFEIIKYVIPCIIIGIIFCCSPYIQVSSLGMTLFWGLIVFIIYNLIITRIFVDK